MVTLKGQRLEANVNFFTWKYLRIQYARECVNDPFARLECKKSEAVILITNFCRLPKLLSML